MFLWRALNNLLPTKQNLFKKGVTNDKMCPICGLEEESVSHIIWECQLAQDVWGGCSRKLQKMACRGRGFTFVFEKMVDTCDKKEMEVFSMIARCIWLRCNKVVHEDSFIHPDRLVKDASKSLEDFWKANGWEELWKNQTGHDSKRLLGPSYHSKEGDKKDGS
jgi:hypothetical protein